MKNHQAKTVEVSNNLKVTKKYQTIKLGIDWHAAHYRVVRIIDGAGPEPAQRFTPANFLKWAEKQVALAQQVFSCYEAGAGGYVLHRQLVRRGVTNYVVAARRLDPDYKGVCNDASDARELAANLERYVGGNPKAMRVVYVPTPQVEQRRQQSRQRQQLQSDRLREASRGRALLLSQGYRESNQWWRISRWAGLQSKVEPWLIERLSIYRRLILAIDLELNAVTQALTDSATGPRPKGMGALTQEAIQREVGEWGRFKNRKQIGSYAGLVGGVSASGPYQRDLPITKAGNRRLRTLAIELAWRMGVYQHQCRLIQRWKDVLLNPKAHARRRKRAIVAVARQVLVDLWRWQTGRVTAQQLGWVMVQPTGVS